MVFNHFRLKSDVFQKLSINDLSGNCTVILDKNITMENSRRLRLTKNLPEYAQLEGGEVDISINTL